MATVTHKVVKGDTLWAISRKYGTTVEAIAKLNNIKNVNLIYVGQVLTISGQSSTEVVNNGGSSSSPPSSTTTTTVTQTQTTINNATITALGLQADTERTIFATWSWNKTNTKEYEIEWDYYTANDKWFIGSHTRLEHTSIQASTYNAPNNATLVRFRVKPISTTYKSGDKDVNYWTASWTAYKEYKTSDLGEPTPLPVPGVPTLTTNDYTLTCKVDNVNGYDAKDGEPYINFEIVKDDKTTSHSGTVKLTLNSAAYSCTMDVGYKYKARARLKHGGRYSEWSNYSENVNSKPSAPSSITSCKAASETSVFLSWNKVSSADTYTIEYAINKDYFDGSNATTKIDGVETTQYTVTGLNSGERYYFRIRAVNAQGNSGWTDIKAVIIGTTPEAPTTWSSTTTVISGEELILYWIHNSEDESIETLAEVEVYYGDRKIIHSVANSDSETQKENKTSEYKINTSSYTEGTVIKWRVRTAGITRTYGDWSTQRTVNIYAPPSLELRVTDKNDNGIYRVNTFPFYIKAVAGPDTQNPISYSVSITSLGSYETIDEIGNFKMISSGDEVYTSYHDTNEDLNIELMPNNVDLQSGVDYRVNCVVAMDTGLTDEKTYEFTVEWTDNIYVPNAEIMYDSEQYVALIRPTCEYYPYIFYKVNYRNQEYVNSNEIIDSIEGVSVDGALTTDGDIVYAGYLNNVMTHFCIIQSVEPVLVPNITLSVYRRDFDGRFIEIGKGLKNADSTFVADPHPNLDMAKYRIVAISDDTGSVSYTDLPGYLIDEKAIILQWNESWNGIDISDDGSILETSWSGCRLRLPYNIDVSESSDNDVSIIKYIGREHPVSYYGTQVGSTATWNVEIPKHDTDTLSGLRRLALWMGDVYVREPSGTGYWANVNVSFSQTHVEPTIPVTLDITRVEGGI